MRYNSPRTVILAAGLALAGALGACGCLVTAYNLQIPHPIGIALAWTALACLCCVCFHRPRGGWLLLLLWSAAVFLCLGRTRAADELLTLTENLIQRFSHAYGFGDVSLALNFSRRTSFGYAVGLIGTLPVIFLCRAVCTGKGTGMACTSVIVPLQLCLVVTDTVPATLPVALAIGCIAMLLLTENARWEHADQGSQLAAYCLIPLVLAAALLFRLIPRDTYENKAPQIREQLSEYAAQLPERFRDFRITAPLGSGDRVDLAALNGSEKQSIPVLILTSQRGGTVYLRSQDYDSYTGTGWTVTAPREELLRPTGTQVDTLTIRTDSPMPNRYLGYFPGEETLLKNGRAANSEKQPEYQQVCFSGATAPVPDQMYLALPARTAERISRYLSDIPGRFQSTAQAAEMIRAYVAGSAEYSRSAPAMPEGEEDFALWFLDSASEGFCVHFATASVVLLRSVGIPARYVTGYRADTQPGEMVLVTSDDAHAWAEYYDSEARSWMILDATPGDEESEETEETVPEETETEPVETTDPTRPEETTPADTQPAATTPETAPAQKTGESFSLSALAPILYTILIAGLAAAGIHGQRIMRLALREKRLNQGTVAARCLVLWQEAEQLARLQEAEPPEELHFLAEKARYSPHPMTAGELAPFLNYRKTSLTALQRRGILWDLVYRYWYCAY